MQSDLCTLHMERYKCTYFKSIDSYYTISISSVQLLRDNPPFILGFITKLKEKRFLNQEKFIKFIANTSNKVSVVNL